MTIEEIQDTILLANSFTLELTDLLLEEQKKGCSGCKYEGQINQINNLVLSLENRISRNDLSLDTYKIYSCLLTAIENFSGSSVIDPNALVSGITIIVDGGGSGDDTPDSIDVFYSDMTGDDGNGGRTTYTNTDLIGWIPFIQTLGVSMLYIDVDFTWNSSTAVLELLPNGNLPAIYSGGTFRITGYKRDGDVPINPLVPLLINWS